jgi:hypothetical protein
MNQAPNDSAPSIRLKINAAQFSVFEPELSQGVGLDVRLSCSIEQLVCGELGVAPEYLDDRIQTVFLNSKAIDDVATATVTPGSVLALSAAMPGVAGATLRKGGRYAPMRQAISYETAADPACRTRGTITLKLFNMIAREIGPAIMQRGVRLSASRLASLIVKNADDLALAVTGLLLDDRPVSLAELQAECERLGDAAVRLTVE